MDKCKYKKVLVIDDNEVDIFVAEKSVRETSFAETIVSKMSAQAGLDYLKSMESTPEELPAIIFLDIIMPVMDGFGFLDEFDKLSDEIHKNCKVILLSTSESFNDLNRANKNKYVRKFLTKPLLKEALEAINF